MLCCVFYVKAFDHIKQSMITMWCMVWTSGYAESVWQPKRLESKFSHAGSQPSLHDWTSINLLDTKACGNFPVWLHSAYLHTIARKGWHYPWLHWEKTTRNSTEESLLDSTSQFSSHWLILICILRKLCEFNSFQGVLWIFLVNYQIWGWSREPLKSAGDVRNERGLGDCFITFLMTSIYLPDALLF